MNKLDKSQNAVFSLQYHFISCVKYRQNVFNNESIIDFLKSKVIEISDKFDVEILEQECGVDHIHILFKSKPTLDITKYINILKGHTSREIRKLFHNELQEKLWGDSFWSPSYFLSTSGNVSLDVLKQYVDNHRKR